MLNDGGVVLLRRQWVPKKVFGVFLFQRLLSLLHPDQPAVPSGRELCLLMGVRLHPTSVQ